MDIKKLLRSPSPPARVILETARAEHYHIPNSTASTPATHQSDATRGRHDSGSAGATPAAQVCDAPAKPARAHPPDNLASRPPPPNPAAEPPSRELARRPTPAEKARENKLRADALCEIANAQLVRCRRCRSWIKLSAKSAFDPAHWNKHRERCVRRAESIVQELREANDQTPFPADAKPPTGSGGKMPRRRAVAAPVTPPPTPDREIDDAGTNWNSSSSSVDVDVDVDADGPSKEDSPLTQLSDASRPSPPPSPPPAPTPPIPLPEPDPVFEEYLARSQRRPTRALASPLRKNWQEWTWATLRKPVWYPEHDEDDEDDGEQDREDDGDHDHERRRRRVPVSNARASPPAHERACESRDCDRTPCSSSARQAVHAASASGTDRRDVPGAAGPVGMGALGGP